MDNNDMGNIIMTSTKTLLNKHQLLLLGDYNNNTLPIPLRKIWK